jgi:hypothetical protein
MESRKEAARNPQSGLSGARNRVPEPHVPAQLERQDGRRARTRRLHSAGWPTMPHGCVCTCSYAARRHAPAQHAARPTPDRAPPPMPPPPPPEPCPANTAARTASSTAGGDDDGGEDDGGDDDDGGQDDDGADGRSERGQPRPQPPLRPTPSPAPATVVATTVSTTAAATTASPGARMGRRRTRDTKIGERRPPRVRDRTAGTAASTEEHRHGRAGRILSDGMKFWLLPACHLFWRELSGLPFRPHSRLRSRPV